MSESINENRRERAIHIGINYGSTDSELNGCVSDSVNLLALSIKLGIDDLVLGIDVDIDDPDLSEKTIVPSFEILMNNKDNITTFWPTKLNILKEIVKAVEDDNIASLFLTYSGHGASGQPSSSNTEESDLIDEYMCTLGNDGEFEGTYESFISDDELFETINNASQNRTTPIVITFVFDCCHSGTIFDLPYGMRKINNNIEFTMQPENSADLNDLVVISGWSGCQDVQYSYENYNDANDMVEGVCTRGFLKAADDLDIFDLSKEINQFDITLSMANNMFAIDNFEDADVDVSKKYQVMNHSSSIDIGPVGTSNIISQKFVVGRANNMDLNETHVRIVLDQSDYDYLEIIDHRVESEHNTDGEEQEDVDDNDNNETDNIDDSDDDFDGPDDEDDDDDDDDDDKKNKCRCVII